VKAGTRFSELRGSLCGPCPQNKSNGGGIAQPAPTISPAAQPPGEVPQGQVAAPPSPVTPPISAAVESPFAGLPDPSTIAPPDFTAPQPDLTTQPAAPAITAVAAPVVADIQAAAVTDVQPAALPPISVPQNLPPPTEAAPQTGTQCPICGEWQFLTTDQVVTCRNGHGPAAVEAARIAFEAANPPQPAVDILAPQQLQRYQLVEQQVWPPVDPPQTQAAQEIQQAVAAIQQQQPQVQPAPAMIDPTQTMIPMDRIAEFFAETPTVDVNAVLDSVPGMAGGPSEGGISWHTLELFKICPYKAYLNKVLGLRRKTRQHALEFGSLFHAVMFMHRSTAAQRTYDPCQAVVNAGGADLAGDVWKLCHAFLTRYAPEESRRWAYRALENNAVMWMPDEKIVGKRRRLPLSCRHDSIVYLKNSDDEPWPGAGPMADGVWIEDLKTAGKNRYELTKAFGMDGQFLMNGLIFRNSDEIERFGPLRGVIVSIAFKHKDPSPDRSCVRLEVPMQPHFIDSFYHRDLKPAVLAFAEKLYHPESEDAKRWPLNRCLGACRGPYGLCPYFDLCDHGMGDLRQAETILEAEFEVVESQKWKPEGMWEPPKEVKKFKGVPVEPRDDEQKDADEKANKRKAAAGVKKVQAAAALTELIKCLNGIKVEGEKVPMFASSRYLVANATEAGVKANLEGLLAGLWAEGTTFERKVPYMTAGEDGEAVEGEWCFLYKVQPRGIQWNLDKKKGQLGYKKLADTLCEDWWDPKPITTWYLSLYHSRVYL
jgi:hypothetical protein